jgi:large subunit ribosomal protein LP2
MRHLAAYLLLVLGGNATPTVDQVNSVITAAGGEADEAKVTALLADLEGKDIHEILAKVRSWLHLIILVELIFLS